MNHGTLLGIREKTHERRRSHRDARLQQGDVAMEAHVATVYFNYFRRFRGMLQLFHMDVAKVDQGCCTYCKCFRGVVQNVSFVLDVCCKRSNLDVAHVSHICCKNMFKMF